MDSLKDMDIVEVLMEQMKNGKRKIITYGFGLWVTWSSIKFWRAVLWRRRMAKLFPCPEYGFLMGNMGDLDAAGGFGLKFFKDMHAKYGPVFGFFLPPFDYHISIDRPEALQVVHKKASERPESTFKVVNYLFKENVLFQHGPWQHQMRRSYQKIVNDPAVLAKLHQTAWDSMQKEIANWDNGRGKDVNAHGQFEPMVYDIVGQVLFGATWSQSDVGKRIMKNHLFCVHNVMKWAFLPWTPWWNKDYQDYANAKQGFWNDVDMMIDKRRKEINAGTAIDESSKDVYSLLLLEKKDDGSLFYDRNTAVSTMCVFLNGSFDTTLNSTSWTLYWLAKYPECQKKLQAELDSALPGLKKERKNPPKKEDLQNVPYLEAVIRESMRRMPAAPINMRVNMESDYDIPGIGTIPKDVTVICPYENSMMKEDVFGKDCDKFIPERFLGSTEEVQKRRQMWTPFGDHSRMCVGRNFALLEVRLFLAVIVSRFSFTLKDPSKDVTALYEAGINVINPPPLFNFVER